MGNCCSQHDDQEKEAAQRSAQIDRQIEQDGKKLKKECKILLLGMSAPSPHCPSPYLGHPGSSESGKSTIVKQMRIIHQDGFSYDTKITYREAIYSNLLESAQAVAAAMHKFKVEPADPSNAVGSSSDLNTLVPFSILSRVANIGPGSGIRSRCGVAVPDMPISLCFPKSTCRSHTPPLARPSSTRICGQSLLTVLPDGQRGIVSTRDRSRGWPASHHPSSFFTEAQRIASADYVPTETDILRCRQRSTGIIETRFSVPPLSWVVPLCFRLVSCLSLPGYTSLTSAVNVLNARNGYTVSKASPASSSVPH